MTTYYNLRRTSSGYLCAKFIDDGLTFDVAAVYELENIGGGAWTCTCPSRARPCKHLTQILPRFISSAKIDTDYFLNPDTHIFYRPIEPDVPGVMAEEPPPVAELSEPLRVSVEAEPPAAQSSTSPSTPSNPWRRI